MVLVGAARGAPGPCSEQPLEHKEEGPALDKEDPCREFPAVKMEDPALDRGRRKRRAEEEGHGRGPAGRLPPPKKPEVAAKEASASSPEAPRGHAGQAGPGEAAAAKPRPAGKAKAKAKAKGKAKPTPQQEAPKAAHSEDVKSAGHAEGDAKQLVLNMDEGGAMRLDDPARVGEKALRGPAIGGDFGKSRRGKTRICAYLKHFRSRAYMYRAVWQGRFKKTRHGIEKKDLCVSASGRIVSKKKSVHGRKFGTLNGWIQHWRMWCRATSQARDALGATGFVKVKKGGTDEEITLFNQVAANYRNLKGTRSDPQNRPAAEPSVDEVAGVAAALTSAGA